MAISTCSIENECIALAFLNEKSNLSHSDQTINLELLEGSFWPQSGHLKEEVRQNPTTHKLNL